jgi:dihydroorotate dehydrogenase electron transfer subunit
MMEPQVERFPVAWQGSVVVRENVQIARDTYRLRFACPEIARRVLPGQFLMFRLAGVNDPLLGRPLAVYDVSAGAQGPELLAVIYVAIGRMTRRLAEVPAGARLEVWGPLGNGFAPLPTAHLVMVAGGIGQTPFLMLAKEYLGRASYGDPVRAMPRAQKVSLCYGARTADYLACVDDFRHAGVDVRLSTDDGSAGRCGLVTGLIQAAVASTHLEARIVCCGPEPMLKATAAAAHELGVPCQVSLEAPMACGVGICFSCVARVRDADGHWDYRRTCVEGPVFDAERVELE